MTVTPIDPTLTRADLIVLLDELAENNTREGERVTSHPCAVAAHYLLEMMEDIELLKGLIKDAVKTGDLKQLSKKSQARLFKLHLR